MWEDAILTIHFTFVGSVTSVLVGKTVGFVVMLAMSGII